MKKNYEKPHLEVTEFRFSEHIASSGQTSHCNPTYNGWLESTGCTLMYWSNQNG